MVSSIREVVYSLESHLPDRRAQILRQKWERDESDPTRTQGNRSFFLPRTPENINSFSMEISS